jgi:predicted RNA-binding Zn-ribbon protein involved in translation (DUF1610 family)
MDDNTFECPNCGAKIYPEMTRCPQCGQNMYPEDEVSRPSNVGLTVAGWGSTLGFLLIGWMIACGIALILHFIIASFFSPSMLGGLGKAVLFLAGPVGALVGGYVSASLAKLYPKLLGGLVGAFTLPVLALFSTHWVQVNLSLLITPWMLLAGLVTILAGVGGGWMNVKSSGNADWKEKWQVRGWEDLLYQDLLRKVRFNGSAADRLIDYEHKQDPLASRLKQIQNALERWERDNR